MSNNTPQRTESLIKEKVTYVVPFVVVVVAIV